ncbi:Homeobox protein A [Sesamum alatum]|uniref:Homeobox protein A n=1 Tax=Sesamum alatum TaxID=300844 RepID=A0AAE1Y367_9LAMI|nr:Homeobox protein A [Sesamum alatum]
METKATGSRSVVTEGNSLYTASTSLGYPDSVDRRTPHHFMPGFLVPFTLGEAVNNLEDIPLPSASFDDLPDERYSSTENQETLTTSGPFVYPFELAETAVACNSSNVLNSPFEAMSYGYEGVPFDTSTRWDFSKFINPSVPVGKVTGSCPLSEWMMTEQVGLNSNSRGSSRFSNELSLSLATSEQCSEMSSSGVTSYSLHNRYALSEHASRSGSDSYKPLHLSPLLSGSRFVHAMQEILAEIAGYALENIEQTSYSATRIADGVNVSFSSSLDGDNTFMYQNNLLQERTTEAKKKHLLALLQVVDERYNRCLDEIHTVTSAFHAVTELDPNLHARFALPMISFMYKNLRERISSHVLAMGAHLSAGDAREETSLETCFIHKQWALQQLCKRDHQFWRPQRGLPERSVSVLRAWMFQNFLHPYPKDAEKHLLALKSGLTRNQVSNWFINARVRLWKPMIEEMYAEMNRRRGHRNEEESRGNRGNHTGFESRKLL